MLEATIKSGIVNKLEKIVGSEYVSTNRTDLYIYSQDMTQAEPSWPDIVVLPKSVEEIQEIVRLANKEKVPIVPYLAGGNIGGLTIPLKGGIMLDLKRMDQILEVNETNMYAIVEAGVTFGMMKAYLDKHHPNVIYSYAFSPPSTGVVANAIAQGLDTLSFRYGASSAWVSGLEVVLPTGDLVKIGSCAVSDTWQALVPMPELAGLFLGWQGTTGVITKMAVSIWPKPKFDVALNFMVMDLEGVYKFLQAMSRTRVPDDLIANSYALGEISRLSFEHKRASIYPAYIPRPDEPEMTITMDVTANTENELNAKLNIIEEVIKDELKDVRFFVPQEGSPGTMEGASRRISWDGKKLHALPSDRLVAIPFQALFVLSSGGGLTWVGTYGPFSKWLETAKKNCELEDKYNITRTLYTRIMNEGHFAAMRWMLPFDKGDPELVERIKALSLEQLDVALENGFVPYKTPVWAVRKIEERAGPEWRELHRKIKSALDPNNILNPGRWGAPED